MRHAVHDLRADRVGAPDRHQADGTREELDRDKLAAGLRKALTRRPVPDGAAEQAADEIEAQLRSEGMTEVPSSKIGEMAMDQLRALDHIAYIRFASVYQSFEDLEELKREVDTPLRPERQPRTRARWRSARPARKAPCALTATACDNRVPMSVLSDRDIRAAIEAAESRIDPYDPAGPPAVVGRPAPGPPLPRLPKQPLPLHRRPRSSSPT